MNKINTLLLVAGLLALVAANTGASQHLLYPLPVDVAEGKTQVTLF